MRWWIILGSCFMGGVSLLRTGDPAKVVLALTFGAGLGLIVYGSCVALTSATSLVFQFLSSERVHMKPFIWVAIFFTSVAVRAIQTNFMFGLGNAIPLFIIGLALSPIWWGVTKKSRQSPWQWFDWLNAGAYITVILYGLSFVVKMYLSSQGIR